MLGLGYWAEVANGSLATSLLGSLLTNIFETEAHMGWAKNVTQHIEYEKSLGEQNLTKKGISFWPDADENCSANLGISDDCRLNLFNQSDVPIITVEGKGYKPKEVRPYIENDNTYDARIKQMFQIYDIPGVKGGVFENLAIPVIAIFTTKIPTANELIYSEDPGPYRRNATFYAPDQTIYRGGDGRCSTYSQLIFPLKWALDHDLTLSKNGENSKKTAPVKFVEYCSLKQQKISPYDHPLIDQVSKGNQNFTDKIYNKNYFDRLGQIAPKIGSELKIKTNGYIGLGCKCLDNTGEDSKNFSEQASIFLGTMKC